MPERILVVDDDPSHLMIMQVNLSNWGYEVAVAYSVKEALQLVTTLPFDLVVCDQRMPPLGDSAATQLLKDMREQGADCEFVVLTAHASVEQAVGSLRAGAYDYLMKGDEWERVKALVERALRHRQTRLEARREREHAEQLKRDLMAMVIHDLKTPISTLKMAIWTLAAERMGPLNEAQKEISELARAETDRLATRVEDLLDVFKMESGEIKLNPRMVDLNAIVQDAVAQIHPHADKNKLTVSFEAGARMPPVTIDTEFISRVLMNLLDNAVKFSMPGGKITVRTDYRDVENRLLVQVTDMGEGIAAEHCDLVFEKFRQAPHRDAIPRFGSGLGLAFCKMAVEAHGGSIGVQSEVKRGSTFYFTLPVN